MVNNKFKTGKCGKRERGEYRAIETVNVIGSPIQKGSAGASASVIKEIPDLNFYEALPSLWDDTKVIEEKIREFQAIARRNKNNWL